jgi:hypothetical protein
VTLDEVKNKIKYEIDNKIPSRFPLRLIFINNIEEYIDIKRYLRDNCDTCISLGDDAICETEDIYPHFGKLRTEIKKYPDKFILLLAMGEYLRFSLKRELAKEKSSFPSFFREMQDVDSKTRVFVLLFAATNLFDRIVPIVDERQKDHIWIVDDKINTDTYNIFVFSDQYKILPPDYTKGLKAWLAHWEMNLKKKNNIVISTRLINNVVNSSDIIDIKVITNIFDYMCARIDNSKSLKQDWLSDEQWEQVNSQIGEETDFNNVILKILNIQNFDQYKVFALWNSLSDLQKNLVLIWYKLNPNNAYCGRALSTTACNIEATVCIRDYLIKNYDERFVKERNDILRLCAGIKYDDAYFKTLSAIEDPKIQLSLLTFSTHEERTFALKIISTLLKSGISYDALKDTLGSNYDLFQQYFFDESYYPVALKAYFRWYTYNKILNRFPHDEMPIPDYNVYTSRFSALQKYRNNNTFILWVDGMGIEWLSLFYNQLNQLEKDYGNFAVEKPIITKALMPTETEFNKQWEDFKPYEKLDKLDNLAHKGIPDDNDYFSCIDAQFEIIQEMADKAVSRLKTYERVIITADHGSSRLAALAFHAKAGFNAPENAKIGGFGRFCELPLGFTETVHADDYEYIKQNDKAYYVIKNYEHFSVSGKALSKDQNNEALSGEIHGGKTPEEYLVPIIILNRIGSAQSNITISFDPKTQVVYKKGNVVTVKLDFNTNIDVLEAHIGSIKGDCKQISSHSWEIQYMNLDKKIYTMEITANGHLLDARASFEVKSKGMSERDYFGGI